MKNKVVLTVVVVIVVVVIGFSVWTYWRSLDHLSKTKHETDSWAVIEDSKGDIIAIETLDPNVWDILVDIRNNETERWIGGIVEEYDNHWGFRFRPDSIIVAQITIEGAQSNIQGISGDLNYWINVWAKETYVLSKVIEIHELSTG
jgi:heme/copper-type cytochrome/quinol oxidase subunit 2